MNKISLKEHIENKYASEYNKDCEYNKFLYDKFIAESTVMWTGDVSHSLSCFNYKRVYRLDINGELRYFKWFIITPHEGVSVDDLYWEYPDLREIKEVKQQKVMTIVYV